MNSKRLDQYITVHSITLRSSPPPLARAHTRLTRLVSSPDLSNAVL